MPKPPKVISIQVPKRKLIAVDGEGQRTIISAGGNRLALDTTVRVTELSPSPDKRTPPVFLKKNR
jgi:lipoprotein-anchoring transpeptidase ErfK/SrfK